MRKKLIPLILSFFCLCSLYAQTNTNGQFTIKGQVVDSLTNETVPYATIYIYKEGQMDKTVKMLACDTDGKFETSIAEAGNYLMKLNSIGKISEEKTFTLTDNNKSVNLGKVFMHEDLQRLDEVTVVAQKPLVKIELDKLTYSMEDDPEALTSSTLDMLRKVPLVTVDGEEKIQLKGNTNFKIYLNGKPSNMLSSENASDVLKSMPANTVKNIEVITDPGAKYDAEGVGGIINIITSKNALQGYTASLRANASTLGRIGGGGNISTKIGKLGLTANYNYNHNNNPWTDSEYTMVTKGTNATEMSQIGRNKRKGNFQYGSLEASYEIDTLNLISVGASLWGGDFKSLSNLDVERIFENQASERYRREGESENSWSSIETNIDYQRNTRKKDELITLSYRFHHSPDNFESDMKFIDMLNFPGYRQHNKSDARTNEHTGQLDYTTPFLEKHTLEAGIKYILRESSSEAEEQYMADGTNNWVYRERPESDFKHTQHIYAGYLGYSVKLTKWGFKTGVRAEGTTLKARFKNDHARDFETDFFNFVPNATLSYQLNMASTLRLGYNMRIYRPNIWLLNPFVNDSDPTNVSYGNPHLDAEKSHGMNLDYSMFTQKFNINASLSYRRVNNSIQNYTFYNEKENNRLDNTFGNIGKNQQAGLYLYTRYAPVPLFNIMLNGGVNYIDISTGKNADHISLENLKNSGWQGNVYSSATFNLPKDFRVDVYGGCYTGWIQLQGKSGSQNFHGLNLNKDFLKKKLTLTLSANNPFQKNMKYTYTMDSPELYSQSVNYFPMRDFRVSVSYRFGTLKDSIKKVQRGITNDDSKGGGGGGGEGGGGGGM